MRLLIKLEIKNFMPKLRIIFLFLAFDNHRNIFFFQYEIASPLFLPYIENACLSAKMYISRSIFLISNLTYIFSVDYRGIIFFFCNIQVATSLFLNYFENALHQLSCMFLEACFSKTFSKLKFFQIPFIFHQLYCL